MMRNLVYLGGLLLVMTVIGCTGTTPAPGFQQVGAAGALDGPQATLTTLAQLTITAEEDAGVENGAGATQTVEPPTLVPAVENAGGENGAGATQTAQAPTSIPTAEGEQATPTAQAPTSSPTAGGEQVTQAEQLERGQMVYEANCAECHDQGGVGPPLNASTLDDYQTAMALFNYISRAMPLDAPGTLSDQQYWAVIAHLLETHDLLPADTIVGEETAADIEL